VAAAGAVGLGRGVGGVVGAAGATVGAAVAASAGGAVGAAAATAVAVAATALWIAASVAAGSGAADGIAAHALSARNATSGQSRERDTAGLSFLWVTTSPGTQGCPAAAEMGSRSHADATATAF
jgi:hypothetical protein